ncbi:type II and III secretion system protein family protein [Rhodoplanes azumiensis]|uniref:Type II and III secretion system protein family protein n=1 Tax=Rhodoplanes azumiensis TaxID=1897628 RepID=A0ABW5AQ92_9BRAD
MSARMRATALGVLLGAVFGLVQPSLAADPRGLPPVRPASTPAVVPVDPGPVEPGAIPLQLGVGKSVVIDLPREVKDVLVADPLIANAVIRTSRRAYLIGVKVGQTSIYFFDETGAQIVGYDIAVTRDLNGVRTSLRRMFPNHDVSIEGVGDGVMLTGAVASPAESQQAFELATRLVGAETKVVNALTIKGRDQVMLKVTVAEVQRDIIKQLGIDLNGTVGGGNTVLDIATQNPFSAFGQTLSNTAITGTFSSMSATLKAMERAGVIRTLAEPTLSAISGESATFLAGGEFPIPAGLSCDTTKSPPVCQAQVDFKKFGISMHFTPVVLSEGRISLKVMTEVSDLSSENALVLTVTGSSQNLTVPSIRVRRADTVVEIPSGGALAMAGMIQEQTKQQINGLPGLLQVPVLGTLFRSRDYVNRQTELMIIVTPYMVRAVSPKNLSKPDDGYADMSDPSSVLMGRLNRIYGVAGSNNPNRTYFGKYGFILD